MFSQLSLIGVKPQRDNAFLFTFSIDEGFKILIPGAWIGEHLAHPVEVVVGNHAVFGVSSHIKELWRREELKEHKYWNSLVLPLGESFLGMLSSSALALRLSLEQCHQL